MLFDTCFNTDTFRTFKKRVNVWNRLLVQFSVIGRASDVTTYCPLKESLSFTTDEHDYLADGLPRFLEIQWKDWKSRPLWHKLQIPHYKQRIYANHLDSRFCPVTWLKIHWELEANADGPICSKCTPDTYRRDLRKLFGIHGFDYTSHSIRRSGAQWARRCGADLIHVRNVGRWCDLKTILVYIAEGELLGRRAIRNNNGADPVHLIWRFDTDSMISTMDKGSITVDV